MKLAKYHDCRTKYRVAVEGKTKAKAEEMHAKNKADADAMEKVLQEKKLAEE